MVSEMDLMVLSYTSSLSKLCNSRDVQQFGQKIKYLEYWLILFQRKYDMNDECVERFIKWKHQVSAETQWVSSIEASRQFLFPVNISEPSYAGDFMEHKKYKWTLTATWRVLIKHYFKSRTNLSRKWSVKLNNDSLTDQAGRTEQNDQQCHLHIIEELESWNAGTKTCFNHVKLRTVFWTILYSFNEGEGTSTLCDKVAGRRTQLFSLCIAKLCR